MRYRSPKPFNFKALLVQAHHPLVQLAPSLRSDALEERRSTVGCAQFFLLIMNEWSWIEHVPA